MQFTYEYDAWGNFEAYDASGNKISTSGRTSPTSAEPTKLCDKNPFKYRGYFYDWQTGLYYLQSRYYDPSTGRFISVDSFEYANPETVDGLNLYVYSANNPVMYIDPTGHGIIGLIIGLVVGLTLSTVFAVANATEGEKLWAVALGGFINGIISGVGLAIGLAMAASGAGLAILAGGFVVSLTGFIGGFTGNIISQAISFGSVDLKVASVAGAINAVTNLMIYVGMVVGKGFSTLSKFVGRFVENLSFDMIPISMSIYFGTLPMFNPNNLRGKL